MNQETEKFAEAQGWYSEALANRVIKSLEKNNITGLYFRTKEEALAKLITLIPEASVVGYGKSLSLNQMGVLDLLRKGNYRLFDRDLPGLSADEEQQLRRDSLLSDVFLTGTNAITMDGKLVNIDGTGNRVAAITYGPHKVIFVAGINKVVTDVKEALKRIKNYVTPIHARRLGIAVPCAQMGACVDCHVSHRVCNAIGIIENQRVKGRITVIIVGEELGL